MTEAVPQEAYRVGGVKRRSETESGPQKPGEINTLSAAAEWCPCAGD